MSTRIHLSQRQDFALDPFVGFGKLIRIEVVSGEVWVHGFAYSRKNPIPSGCGFRCFSRALSNTADEPIGDLPLPPTVPPPSGDEDFGPVAVNLYLTQSGDFVVYEGGLSVTITGITVSEVDLTLTDDSFPTT